MALCTRCGRDAGAGSFGTGTRGQRLGPLCAPCGDRAARIVELHASIRPA